MAAKTDEPISITVTRGAVRLITQCLQQPGWAKETSTLYRAGKLAASLEDQFDDLPPDSSPEEAMREWAFKEVSIDLTAKTKKLMTACLKHHVGQGAIAPTQHFISLVDALEIDID